jgi:hypothetical protein
MSSVVLQFLGEVAAIGIPGKAEEAINMAAIRLDGVRRSQGPLLRDKSRCSADGPERFGKYANFRRLLL